MSKTREMRANIVTALSALPALAGVSVKPIAMPEDIWFEANGAPVVGVCYGGLEAAGPQTSGPREATGTLQTFLLVVSASGYRSGTESLTMALGADELAERVRAIRATPIGPAGQAGVRLLLRNESLMEAPERTAVGGPIAYVCTYHTTPVTV